MTRHPTQLSRRTALRTLAGIALGGTAGCLDDGSNDTANGGNAPLDGQNTLKRVAVDGTTLVVELTAEADIDHVNLIQPNGESWGTREVAAGARRVTFEIGTAYQPGGYRVVAVSGEETVAEITKELRPEIQIRDVGLYRNNPEKPWDEVYGESKTDRKKNGEAFVTVENTGTGPDAVIELRFSGDVPNPVENPRDGGMYGTERMIVAPGKRIDIFSNSFPFGSEAPDGMGCSTDGNSGQFAVVVETAVGADQVSRTYGVEYSGSDDMTDCKVTIEEA